MSSTLNQLPPVFVNRGRGLGFAVWLLALLVMCCAVPSARAQGVCSPQWQPFDPSTSAFPGHSGNIGVVRAAVMWDPDGAGPLPRRLVIGGDFAAVGNLAARGLAMYDTETGIWLPIGAGTSSLQGSVNCLAVLPNGELLVGGRFSATTPTGTAFNLARWNGTRWTNVPNNSFFLGSVTSLLVLANGDMLVNSPAFFGFVRADGTISSSFASPNSSLLTLAQLPSGDIIAGGTFSNIGSVNANGIARWNGTSWSAIGSGLTGDFGLPGYASSLLLLPNGDLLVSGQFTSAGGVPANNIARWNGTSWSALGTGLTGPSGSAGGTMHLLANGDVIVTGGFTAAGGIPANNIARWNGSAWSAFGTGPGSALSPGVSVLVSLPNGDLFAGGSMTAAGSDIITGMARWNGSSWSSLFSGINNRVTASVVMPNGDLVIGGLFTTVGGVSARSIARFTGSSWAAFGSGLNGTPSALAVLPNGDLIAAGTFTSAGGVQVSNIARWNGTAWSALSAGVSGAVSALAVLPNGDLIVGGQFATAGGVTVRNIARWNGTAWSALGAGMDTGGTVRSLTVLPNGDLVAGGLFTNAGGVPVNYIARWNGTVWSPLGQGTFSAVTALAVLPNGDLIAGGDFSTAGEVLANRVARWNGSSWSVMGAGVDFAVAALIVLPGGDLAAAGTFASINTPASRIMRWNGSSWSSMGFAPSAVSFAPGVTTLTVLPGGDLLAGGNFSHLGSVVLPYLTRFGAWVPAINLQPTPQTVVAGQSVVLSAAPVRNVPGVSVQWRRNGVPVVNGAGGASAGGGTVTGATAVLASPTDGAPAVLTISNAQPGDSGQYSVVLTNACGSVTSIEVTLTVTPALPQACSPADIVGAGDLGNQPDGTVDGSDFIAFINSFATGDAAVDPLADIAGAGADGNEPDGTIDGTDFIAFVNAFAIGC